MSQRLLMPFTQSIDWNVLSRAFQLAQQQQATLIAFALYPLEMIGSQVEMIGSQENWKKAENDLINNLQYGASKYQVPIEADQAFTKDVVQSILSLVKSKKCQSIVIFIDGGGNPVLLQKDEMLLLIRSIGPEGPELQVVQL